MHNPGIQRFRVPPREKNRAAMVFVHGISGDRAGTWGEIPSRLAADRRLGRWDMFGFGYPAVEVLIDGLTGGKGTGVAYNSARVAVETGHFQDAIEELLPFQARLDDVGAVQLGIALYRRCRREEAIQVLTDRKPEGTDVLGVLAGRLKRRWQVTRRAKEIISARELYSRGYQVSSGKKPPNHDQVYFADLSGLGKRFIEDLAKNYEGGDLS